jgi:hypothetical protein
MCFLSETVLRPEIGTFMLLASPEFLDGRAEHTECIPAWRKRLNELFDIFKQLGLCTDIQQTGVGFRGNLLTCCKPANIL